MTVIVAYDMLVTIHGTSKMTVLLVILRSRESEDWKHRNQIPQISWPPQSPDLSPIKNIWLLLKNKIKNRLFLIRNLADLKTQLMTAWNEVPLFYIQKLYASLPQRCREVLIQKGTITKY